MYNGLEVSLLQSTGRGCRASDADTARLGRGTIIEGDHILIGSDVSLHQRILSLLTGQLGELLAEVKQHQVVIGTARDHVIAQLKEGICHSYRIGMHLSLVGLEGRLQSLVEGNRLGSNHVLQRSTLYSGEDGRVDQLRHHLDATLLGSLAPGVLKVLTHQDDTTTRTSQGLVGRRGNDVGILHRIGEETGSNETCRVSHIDHKDGTDAISDLAHTLIVPLARVGRGTADDQLRVGLLSLALHIIVVYATILLAHTISYGVVEDTGGIDK